MVVQRLLEFQRSPVSPGFEPAVHSPSLLSPLHRPLTSVDSFQSVLAEIILFRE